MLAKKNHHSDSSLGQREWDRTFPSSLRRPQGLGTENRSERTQERVIGLSKAYRRSFIKSYALRVWQVDSLTFEINAIIF